MDHSPTNRSNRRAPRRLAVGLAAVLLLAAGACSDDGADDTAGEPSASTAAASTGGGTGEQAGGAEGTGTLFVLTAGGASFEEGSPGTLTLDPVASGIVAFSDRPERAATRTGLQELVDGWDRFGFAADPPNAALVGADGEGAEQISVVELSDPELDGERLRFTAVVVDDVSSPQLDGLVGASTGPPPASLSAVSLFIDAAGGQPTIANVQVNIEGLTGTFTIQFDDGAQWIFDQGVPSVGAGGTITSNTAAVVNVGAGAVSLQSIYGDPVTGGVAGALQLTGDTLQGTATFPDGTSATLYLQGPGTSVQLVNGQPFSMPVPD